VLFAGDQALQPGIRPPLSAKPFRQFFDAHGEPAKLKALDLHD
jgi:hypothetical protein